MHIPADCAVPMALVNKLFEIPMNQSWSDACLQASYRWCAATLQPVTGIDPAGREGVTDVQLGWSVVVAQDRCGSQVE